MNKNLIVSKNIKFDIINFFYKCMRKYERKFPFFDNENIKWNFIFSITLFYIKNIKVFII